MVSPTRILRPMPNPVIVTDPSVNVGIRLKLQSKGGDRSCTGCPKVTWIPPANGPPPWWPESYGWTHYQIVGSMIILDTFVYPNGVYDFKAVINGVECPMIVRVNTDYGMPG